MVYHNTYYFINILVRSLITSSLHDITILAPKYNSHFLIIDETYEIQNLYDGLS